MEEIDISVRLSAQRALWGHVPPCLRSASIEVIKGTIKWRCLFDADATEDDFELLRMAGTEIITDFYPKLTIDEEYTIIPYPQNLTNLK